MNKKAMVDSDIIIDLLTMRGVFYDPAAELFSSGYHKRFELYTSSVILSNVCYILRKKHGIEKTKDELKKLRTFIRVLPITEQNVDDALNSSFSDFEDALQYFAAKENKIPVLITRNTRHYKVQDIKIQTAGEFLAENTAAI